MDIGAAWVYNKPEYRQPGGYKDKHTLYLFKFGFSILDIGNIKYKNASVTTIINNNAVGWNLNNEKAKFENQKPGIGAVDSALNEIPNIQHQTRDLVIGLPTRLALSARSRRIARPG